MAIKCGHCKGHHDAVAEVRICSQRTKGEWVMGSAPVETREVTEGMWYLGDKIVKVLRAVHGSGQLYTKELNLQLDGSWRFERLYSGMKELRKGRDARKMTVEEAADFGKIYGVCCRCAATLTDEESIAAGIGPICRGKF